MRHTCSSTVAVAERSSGESVVLRFFVQTGAVIAAGVAMIVWSRRAFEAAATPIRPFTESTALIRHGLYRWSRNPMYVGAVLLVSGFAFLLGSVTPLLVAVGLFVILQEGFVRHEERLL